MTMAAQDLLERYLYAVGHYLPAAGKEDTLAELRANLQAEMDKADLPGRALTEAEEAEVLRKHGHPSMVAERYRPVRQLVNHQIEGFREAQPRRINDLADVNQRPDVHGSCRFSKTKK
jgi:hypothetical protein